MDTAVSPAVWAAASAPLIWDATSALRRLEELSAEAQELKAQQGDLGHSLSNVSDTSHDRAAHLEAGIASLRAGVEQLKRFNAPDGILSRRASAAPPRKLPVSNPFRSEAQQQLFGLREEIEELLADRPPFTSGSPGHSSLWDDIGDQDDASEIIFTHAL